MWNYLQVEVDGHLLRPVIGPGGMTRADACAFVRTLLTRHAEVAPFAEALLAAWDAEAQDDTVYAESLLWAVYEADDALVGGRAWVEDLARGLRESGSKIRIVW